MIPLREKTEQFFTSFFREIVEFQQLVKRYSREELCRRTKAHLWAIAGPYIASVPFGEFRRRLKCGKDVTRLIPNQCVRYSTSDGTKTRDILLVSKRPHHLLVEDLLTVAIRQKLAQSPRLHLEATFASLTKDFFRDFALILQITEARTFALGHSCERIRTKINLLGRERGILQEGRSQPNGDRPFWKACRRCALPPSRVGNHIRIGGIRPVSVRIPIGWIQMNLNIPDKPPPLRPDFQHRPLKVRPSPLIPVPGINHTDILAISRRQMCRTKDAVVPNRLNMTFGNGLSPISVKEAFWFDPFHR